VDSVVEDMEARYAVNVEQKGHSYAQSIWIGKLVIILTSFVIKSFSWMLTMFKNYLKVAFRNIKRSKGYSFSNIAGLSVGMTCFILIMLFVKYELSYDRYHENADDIYRVVMRHPGDVWLGTDWWNNNPGALKAALLGECPEIHRIARVRRYGGVIHHENKHNIENRFFIVDPEFLEIFTFSLIAGDPETALSEPLNLLLTEEMAEKYFGDENPIGEILNFDGKYDFKITGILKNVPDNSHFQFDFLASFKTLYTIYRGRENSVEMWGNNNYKTYVQVRKDNNRENFENRFPVSVEKFSGRERDSKSEFHVQPLTDIHLKGHMNSEIDENSDIRYVYLFSAVAFLIMLIACLNYMNLSTSRSAKRSREVGVRKVVGAGRINLIRQFLGEAVILSVIAISMSFIFVKLLLPAFGSFVERELSFEFFGSVNLFLSLICIAVSVGIVSGIYPAFFLSSFKPGNVIKNVSGLGSKTNISLRNTLVVFQFIISIVLIFCTIVIYNQLKFIGQKNLGYNKDHIIIVNIYDDNLRTNYEPLKNELLRYSKILDITVSRHSPAFITGGGGADWEGKHEDDNTNFYIAYVDYDFIDFYGLKLLEGRNFSKDFTTDEGTAYILNRTAIDVIGWEDPVGKRFSMREDGFVIGVVDNFHFHELRSRIKPLVIVLIDPNKSWTIGCLSIKISPEDIPGTLTFIEDKYKEFSSGYPFSYSFLDDRVDSMYRSEQRLGKSFAYFTVIAIFIACLGLFGLSSYTAECKTKEIGIRKVLGASVSSIVVMHSKEFLKWVILANLVAYPIAYILINKWLQDFAYKTDIGIWTFILSGTFAFIIAFFTVSYQLFKAATANPVDSLRYE
jgi:putative ABC transport system permease protein